MVSTSTSDFSKDLRSEAVPSLRYKTKKSNYKGVSPSILGAQVNKLEVNSERKLAHQMAKYNNVDKRLRRAHGKGKPGLPSVMWDEDEELATPRGRPRPSSHRSFDDDTVAGVLYSYDSASTPSLFGDAWGTLVTQAEAKYENKVVEHLVKTEYEVVDSTSEEEDEDEYEFV